MKIIICLHVLSTGDLEEIHLCQRWNWKAFASNQNLLLILKNTGQSWKLSPQSVVAWEAILRSASRFVVQRRDYTVSYRWLMMFVSCCSVYDVLTKVCHIHSPKYTLPPHEVMVMLPFPWCRGEVRLSHGVWEDQFCHKVAGICRGWDSWTQHLAPSMLSRASVTKASQAVSPQLWAASRIKKRLALTNSAGQGPAYCMVVTFTEPSDLVIGIR